MNNDKIYIKTSSILTTYPEFKKRGFKQKDFSALVRIGLLDGYFDQTYKRFMIKKTSLMDLCNIINRGLERRKLELHQKTSNHGKTPKTER